MKPYRGTLLAAAVLLATLPLSGCGEAEDFAKTNEITLSTSTSTVVERGRVLMTVKAPRPETGYECRTDLEYRAEGGGYEQDWRTVPGEESTRIFELRPHHAGVMSVMARGRCINSQEDWKYSNQIDVAVTAPITTALTPPTVTATATPATITVGTSPVITVALNATAPVGCTLNLRYQYSGGGYTLQTVNPASQGLSNLPLPPAGYSVGTVTVMATGYCSENPSATVTSTATVTVSAAVVVPPTITAPDAPTHVGAVNNAIPTVFTSGGSVCSNGEAVQYEFSATNSPVEGTPTAWGAGTTVSFTWGAVLPAVTVSVRARCATSNSVTSATVTSISFAVL